MNIFIGLMIGTTIGLILSWPIIAWQDEIFDQIESIVDGIRTTVTQLFSAR